MVNVGIGDAVRLRIIGYVRTQNQHQQIMQYQRRDAVYYKQHRQWSEPQHHNRNDQEIVRWSWNLHC